MTVQKMHAQASFVEWKRAKNSGENSGGDEVFWQGLSEILHTRVVREVEQCHRCFCMKGPERAFWGGRVGKMLFEPRNAR